MSAPDWRDLFARAVYATAPVLDRPWEDAPTHNRTFSLAVADTILAAIAERGYRLHRDHDWQPYVNPNGYSAGDQKCARPGCFAMKPGITEYASCEGGP